MKTRKLLPFLLAVALVGCVPSLHPLFTDNDVVFEPGLIGTWTGENDKDNWQFKPGPKSDEKRYEVIYTDKDGKKGQFVGSLGKIDGMMFLDLYPGEAEIQANDFYKAHLLPAHTFLKIEQIRPTLKMRSMDPEKFNKMLTSDPNLIRHEVIADDRAVITASTQELQQFMQKHANDEGLFGQPDELKRLEPVEPNAPDANNVPGDSNGLPV